MVKKLLSDNIRYGMTLHTSDEVLFVFHNQLESLFLPIGHYFPNDFFIDIHVFESFNLVLKIG
jgi:hypothetical protein